MAKPKLHGDHPKVVSFLIHEDLYGAINSECKTIGITQSTMMRRAMELILNHQPTKNRIVRMKEIV